MKHIELFEGWGDTINRKSDKFILIQKNHYLTQERKIGYFSSIEEAMPLFLKLFKKFINDEWNGVSKRYFLEWNPDVGVTNSWDEFFSQIPGIGDETFYIEDSDSGTVFSEVDLLKMVHPSYLESFLPFS